ncbi:cytochrome c1 [Marinomonas pollencensis]|uniref:Ubiquinol-cytochrome c reductase cytochrome c1 subunit n=1 Tax=Marinomonas pollencensis TaxID=491954 RepID=A0A3E0DJZ6_9GAMM|nr:cytochrome c1 [Marinomonas pollencensis]REG81789.1 ubiquinol-cytochrome c reductase cytochrome c1 subunit [Marinomonas pollencensis]
MSILWHRYVCWFGLVILSPMLFAQGEGVTKIVPDLQDLESLQRGFALYSNYCSSCHQLEYVRYNRIAEDLTIPKSLFAENLLPKYARMGDQITSAISKSEAKAWFGVVPPDLTLAAGLHDPNWIYRYLQGFYQDKSRPFGVNNRVLPNSMMPNVLEHLQGERWLRCKDKARDFDGKHATSVTLGDSNCVIVDGEIKGQLTDQEFKKVAYDIANFLTYTADPSRSKRESLGLKVLLFIGLFTLFAYLLKREFWRDLE